MGAFKSGLAVATGAGCLAVARHLSASMTGLARLPYIDLSAPRAFHASPVAGLAAAAADVAGRERRLLP